MPGNHIFVCFLKTEGLTRDVLTDLVLAEDILHADLYRDEVRSVRALAARALRRWGLYTFVGRMDPVIAVGEHGKPVLVGLGHFNSSSAPGIVAFAYREAGPIGLDVEAVSRGETLGLTLEELTIWTEREAVAKGIGVGLELALEGLVAIGPGLYLDEARNEMWRTYQLPLPHAWLGAVSAKVHCELEIVLRKITLGDLRQLTISG